MNYCLYIRSWLLTLPSERVSDTEHWDAAGLKKQACTCEAQDKRGGSSRNSAFTRCCSLLQGWMRDLSHPSPVSPRKFRPRWRIRVARGGKKSCHDDANFNEPILKWLSLREKEEKAYICVSACRSVLLSLLCGSGLKVFFISLCLFIHEWYS